MRIADMSFENLEEVVILGGQLGYPCSLADVQKRFAETTKRSDQKLFVAEDLGGVLGWIQVQKETATLLSEPRAEVSALVVNENCRGKGIGQKLLARAEEWAAENKLFLVRLRSNTIRTEAHGFYQKQGYVIKKSWHLFTKSLSEEFSYGAK